ncbi:MAG: glutathione S-transferase family protein [Candidatus Binatia bacterium]
MRMITLYHYPQSRSLRVLWLLEELALPYQLEVLALGPTGLQSERYRQIHPLGRVPALRDGDVLMHESGAILEYLLERYGDGRLAPAPDSPERATFLQWFHYAEATALPPLSDLAQHSVLKPEAERIAALVPDAIARARASMAVVEGALAGRHYLCGREFTAADIMMGYTVQLAKWFHVIGEESPNQQAYLARLNARPAMQKALAPANR